jgi:predicted Zn-dependent protease
VTRAPVALGLLAAACGTVSPPERPEAYAFAVPYDSTLQLVFHWTPASLPVRIWAHPSLRQYVAEAIRTWEALSLYGEFRGVLVSDSLRADVIVQRAGEHAFSGAAAELLDCAGSTRWSVELDTTITLPFHTVLNPRAGAAPDNLDRCFAMMARHELGHALGLLLHSDDAGDLMSVRPAATAPTERDRSTFSQLYHSPVTVRLPAGR